MLYSTTDFGRLMTPRESYIYSKVETIHYPNEAILLSLGLYSLQVMPA